MAFQCRSDIVGESLLLFLKLSFNCSIDYRNHFLLDSASLREACQLQALACQARDTWLRILMILLAETGESWGDPGKGRKIPLYSRSERYPLSAIHPFLSQVRLLSNMERSAAGLAFCYFPNPFYEISGFLAAACEASFRVPRISHCI